MKRIVFILFLFTCFPGIMKAQNTFSGKVIDEKMGPLNAVNVVILEKGKNNIAAFGITGKYGEFSISVSLLSDSIILKVSAIGYATQSLVLPNRSQVKEFTLIKEATYLPTVTVKAKPISQGGDTISYHVESFTGKQDKMIGDVISKLPGLQMDENGRITFEGKPISHYYIDGIDLLGGKYNIANQNIPADLVERVQILQNHQSVKLLKGVQATNEPALNLRLKSKAKNKLLGQGQVGFGATPLLWDNAITGLNFRKAFQLITSYKNSNAGATLQSEIADNIIISRVGENAIKNENEEAIQKFNWLVPALNNRRYLFNNSNLLHFNTINILPNTGEITINASYFNDYSSFRNSVQSSYLFPSASPVTFFEQIVGHTNSNILQARIGYALNKPKMFLKNNTSYSGDVITQNGNIINDRPIYQKLNTPSYHFINDFTVLSPIREKIVTFNSRLQIDRNPQSLQIFPGQFPALINQNVPYEALLQDAVLNKFTTENNVLFTQKTGKLSNQAKAGFIYTNKQLNSALSKVETGNKLKLADSFANDLAQRSLMFFAEIATSIKKGKTEILSKLPLQWTAMSLTDKIQYQQLNSRKLFFNPFIQISSALSSSLDLFISYLHQKQFGGFLQQAGGYILTDYRSIKVSDSFVPENGNQNASVSIQFKKPLSAFFADITLSGFKNGYNLLNNTYYNEYFITSYAEPINNEQRGLNFGGSLNKYFVEEKLSLKGQANINSTKAQLLQENNLVNSISRSYIASINVMYSKIKNVEINFCTKINSFSNYVQEPMKAKKYFKGRNSLHQLNWNYTFTKNTLLYNSNEFYQVKGSNTDISNYFFCNIGITQKVNKMKLEIEWANITNNKTYKSVNTYQNLQRIVTYQIRPSTISAKLYFHF